MISVIVPVYNVEPYLRNCLDSITGQTYKDIEILIIDDGSKDQSGAICDEYAGKDERISVFHTENKGLSAARNLGIEHAKGEWITFVDSDDWVDPDMLERALSAAEKENLDLVFWGYVREYGDHSAEKRLIWVQTDKYDEKQVREKLFRRLFGIMGKELARPEYSSSFNTAWGKLYRSGIIKENGIRFVDTALIGSEDILFNVYAVAYVQSAIYLDRCMYHYRKNNAQSLTTGFDGGLFRKWQNLFDRMEEYVRKENLPEIFSEALNHRIALSIIGIGLAINNSTLTPGEKK
ncbi:MAG: glycosyltransferase family 2 protein, partial [Lachnospiraceae bacterium]|nr:glycosyltransferase family 2 protein [Lachnospiraceae bacterium]